MTDSYKKQGLLTLREHEFIPDHLGWSVSLVFLLFELSYCVSLRSELHVVMSVTISV